ncbi:MAG: ferrochelatase [Candidatus Kapabacteria bacterium]|nr:ferrochelatase [Candidatus Kapabacteria bacterium]
MQKKAVILINTGSPDSFQIRDVRCYLSQFLNDKRVINLPYILRKFIVNLIIVPFRAPKSAVKYKQIWTKNGSPLIVHTQNLVNKLQKKIDDDTTVFFAMRYGNPSIKSVLSKIKESDFEHLTILPLFPQYASSTTGSIYEYIFNSIKDWNTFPSINFINQFYDNPQFINAFVNRIKSYQPEKFEHIIFSFHGLPLSHLDNVHPKIPNKICNCKKMMPITGHGKFCYKACCYEMSRLLAKSLNLNHDQFTISFQSRMTKNWISPFTDEIIASKAKAGVKNILVVAGSFVADCLETTLELGVEYSAIFKTNGGENLQLVESLNDSDDWVNALIAIIHDEIV